MKKYLLPPILELKNVTVIKGDENKKVLNRVSLKILPGENIAILGPNGAGKTSLIKIITREYYPLAQKGSFLKVWGEEHWNIFELRYKLGIISNDLQFRCVREISGMETALSGFFGSIGTHGQHVSAEKKKKALEVLRFLEIDHLKDRKMSVMSSGEARRFLIARALVHDPCALVLDEPSNSLDLRSMYHFRILMRKIARFGTSVILVTQNLQDIIPEVKRVVLMKEGRIILDGARDEVLTPRNIRTLFEVPVKLQKSKGYYYTIG